MPEPFTCSSEAIVGDCEELICSLPTDHPGRLHFDDIDKIWWVKDGETDA